MGATPASGRAAEPPPPLAPEFYARPVLDVARDLIGCTISHGETAGRIVETEAYHESEPACHAYVGLTARTRPLFGPPGRAYVYRSYGIHALLNAVCEPGGIGAAVLIRALEPLAGLELMRERRGVHDDRQLCSGPGKLSQALGVTMEHNDTDLAHGDVVVRPPAPDAAEPQRVCAPRIGITKAIELPWRICEADSPWVSRPWPTQVPLRRRPRAAR